MIPKYYRLLAGVLIILLSAISCSRESFTAPDPAAGMTKIYEGYAPGAATRIILYSKEASLEAGFTHFNIALFDSLTGERIDQAMVSLNPLMDMGMMKHAAPVENPSSETAINHLFPCSVVFIMSSMGGNWTLGINLRTKNGKEGTLVVPLTVAEPVKAKVRSFTASGNGNKYFVALVEPAVPKVGINAMELAIYKKTSMMSFPPDSSLSVTFEPEMPSMNHGSPNNINPLHTGTGHYKGKVNFTMTGWWRLHFQFLNGTSVADSTQYFDVEF